ncbi:M15 family metallopeptidase [Anaeromicropila herbilytica]|uniref:D-alanyl-D-alanine carboxypeptidase-like core domain-containing protein n=1 Tax=Anaeromicropila herbilytica TaxID=2785025 RepID=A0A7R7EMX8_9FIRM|nr:M15 family metallopeptidase [Anaeromicropila herbilytica]BCN31738.1 hypothetical protein bsdtb5_30330 [Anaeromicropila herbilytica]
MNEVARMRTKPVVRTHKKKRKRKITRYLLIFTFLTIIALYLYGGTTINDTFEKVQNTNIIQELSNRTSSQEDNHNHIQENSKDKAWNLILVNRWNAIPDDFSIHLKTLKNDYQIDERIYPELQEMFDDARSEGIYPLIGSAFRSNEKQQSLFDDKVNKYLEQGYKRKDAVELANTWVASPGTSEHQIGLALDINAEKNRCTNDEVYSWLRENSYKYGFILRYPKDKTNITGTCYEPWHFRYVGKKVAKVIHERGICLEEYLSNLD